MEEETPTPPPQADNKELTPLEQIKEERILLDKSYERLLEENNRTEQLKAKEMLGGRAEAGEAPVTKEETPQEYADKVMRGEL